MRRELSNSSRKTLLIDMALPIQLHYDNGRMVTCMVTASRNTIQNAELPMSYGNDLFSRYGAQPDDRHGRQVAEVIQDACTGGMASIRHSRPTLAICYQSATTTTSKRVFTVTENDLVSRL